MISRKIFYKANEWILEKTDLQINELINKQSTVSSNHRVLTEFVYTLMHYLYLFLLVTSKNVTLFLQENRNSKFHENQTFTFHANFLLIHFLDTYILYFLCTYTCIFTILSKIGFLNSITADEIE